MIKHFLIILSFITISSFLILDSPLLANTCYINQKVGDPDPNFGYKKVEYKSGYNFEDKDGNLVFSKPVIDGYPLSKSHFAIVGKNKKYALVNKEEKYITKFVFSHLYRINDDFFGIDKKDKNEVMGRIINRRGAVVSEGGFVSIIKEDHDIYKVALYDEKIKQRRFGIIDKDFNYLVPPKCYHIRSKGERAFLLLIGQKYQRFYNNSLKYARSYIRIDKDLNVRAFIDHIKPSNLSNFNKILKKYFGSKKKYKLEELTYLLEFNYGIQRNNQVELNKEHQLTYNYFREMGKMIINAADEKTFEIPVYFSLNNPDEDFDSKFILGTKDSDLDNENPAFFDSDFNEIAGTNNGGLMAGFKKYYPQFIAISHPSTGLFEIHYLNKKRGQTAELVAPLFGFDELYNVPAYVDEETLAFLKKHDFKNIYADLFKKQVTFYQKDNPAVKYNGNLSHVKGGAYMSTETYEEVQVFGYDHEVILNRSGQIHPPFSDDVECDLFEYRILKDGVIYPAKVDGEVALFDKDFNNYLDGFKNMNYSVLKNGIGVMNDKGQIIGVKDFDGDWLVPSAPNNDITEVSPSIITVRKKNEKEMEDDYGYDFENMRTTLLIFKDGKWNASEVKSVSNFTFYASKRKPDFQVVGTNDLIGLIDYNGNELFPIEFISIMGKQDFKVTKRKDSEGKRSSEVYDQTEQGYQIRFSTPYEIRQIPFTDKFLFNEFDKKEKGILNSKGEVILRTEYISLRYVEKVDLWHFSNAKAKTNGLIDISGKIYYEQPFASSDPKVITHNSVNYILFNGKGKIHVLNDKGKLLDTIPNAKFGYGSHSGTEYFDLLTMDKIRIRYNLITKRITKL